MEYRFRSDEWRNLAAQQQARRCRVLAAEAQDLAKDASPDIGQRYLAIAQGWLQLADHIERAG